MEKDHLESLGVDKRIVLKWIFKMWDGKVWTGLRWLWLGQMVSSCECGNEPWVSI